MKNVLKVKIAGERVKYEVSRVTFDERDLQKAKGWKWEKKGNSMVFKENLLDIKRDFKTFDCRDLGIAIRPTGNIYYEFGETNGKISMDNMLSAVNHPILTAIRNTNKVDELCLTTATVYDEEDTKYWFSLELDDDDFEPSLLEIITINDPITNDEYIVEFRYGGKKMEGRADGLPFREPKSDKTMYMLTVPQKYADALGLAESRKLDNIMRFDDFIKEENTKDRKKPVDKVKSVKDYTKISEDYIHSFIDEHERGVEPEEEE